MAAGPGLTVAELLRRHRRLLYWLAHRACRAVRLPATDLEEVVAEVRLQAVRAARLWDPSRGVSFGSYAARWAGLAAIRYAADLRRKGLSGCRFTRVKLRLRYEPAVLRGEDGGEDEFLECTRRYYPTADPLLHAWCDPENAAQRAGLSWRERVALYLLYVERLSHREVGGVFSVSKERSRQLADAAVRQMARTRVERAVAAC